MVFRTSDLSIRTLRQDDLEWARQMHNDPEVLANLTDPHEVTPGEQILWFSKLQENPKSQRWVVEHQSGELVGLVRLDDIDYYNKSICIGLDICKAWRGKHLAKPIYKAVLDIWLRDKEYHRAWLLVAEFNTRAVKLYTELGFRHEGIEREALLKNGQYYNYLMMGLLRKEHVQSSI